MRLGLDGIVDAAWVGDSFRAVLRPADGPLQLLGLPAAVREPDEEDAPELDENGEPVTPRTFEDWMVAADQIRELTANMGTMPSSETGELSAFTIRWS